LLRLDLDDPLDEDESESESESDEEEDDDDDDDEEEEEESLSLSLSLLLDEELLPSRFDLRFLFFCLSARILSASPAVIARGALLVTGCPDPPNSAGTTTLGPSFAFLGLRSCCVRLGRAYINEQVLASYTIDTLTVFPPTL
jgi:hypothetical protein